MTRKWVPAGKSPEGRTFFKEVKIPTLKEGQVPPPPEGPAPINPATGEEALLVQEKLPEPKIKKKGA